MLILYLLSLINLVIILLPLASCASERLLPLASARLEQRGEQRRNGTYY